jgi:hypothetical protein
VGVPDLQGVDRGPRAYIRRGCEPAGGANFLAPCLVVLLFTRHSTVDPQDVLELEDRERPPSTLRNALTAGPREVPELEVRKLETWMAPGRRPPPKLETSIAGPLGGAAGRSDSGHHQSWRRRWWPPWGVLEAGPTVATTEAEDVDGGPPRGCWQQGRQRPPSKLKTSMAGPLGGVGGKAGSGYHRS